MPWYWIVVIPLLVSNGGHGLSACVHRQRRVQEGKYSGKSGTNLLQVRDAVAFGQRASTTV